MKHGKGGGRLSNGGGGPNDNPAFDMSEQRIVIPRPSMTGDGPVSPMRRISEAANGKNGLEGLPNPAFDPSLETGPFHRRGSGMVGRIRSPEDGAVGSPLGKSLSSRSKLRPDDDDDDEDGGSSEDDGWFSRAVDEVYGRLGKFVDDNWRVIKIVLVAVFFLLYNAYLVVAIVRAVDRYEDVQNTCDSNPKEEGCPFWCNGTGFLFAITGVVYINLIYFQIIKRFFGKALDRAIVQPFSAGVNLLFSYRLSSLIAYAVVVAAIVIFVIFDTMDARHRLKSGLGVIVIVSLAFVFSRHPGKVVWRHVVWGLALQFVFAFLVLRWDFGRNVLDCLSQKVSTFLEQANAGSEFVYGYLVNGQVTVTGLSPELANLIPGGVPEAGFSVTMRNTVFAFSVLSVIFFFSFVTQMLYYYGAMQWLVAKIGWLLQVTIGTTAAESMSASANIFVGQTEAPLMVKPYLPIMTKSELHAIMTGGFATVAGTVLAAYISFGVSASHILAASVMSAPAALAISKLFYPEVEKSKTTADSVGNITLEESANVLDAAATGASQAISLVQNVIGNLIAFTAFIAFLDSLVGWFAAQVGRDDINFTWLIGKIFMPLAWTMGVEWEDCDEVGELVGIKTIVNEFVAYSRLKEFADAGRISDRSKLISTYALCGFSNVAGIGIQLGGLSALAPERKSDLSEIAVRALIAGSMACFLTACIAGLLIDS